MTDEKQLPAETAFSLDGFQVVRREFFAHTREPALTFSHDQIYVNTASLAQFEHADYVQVLINPNTCILALRPCREGSRDSLPWCGVSDGKRKPRQTTCKLFFAMLADMMHWNRDYRYRLLGRLIRANGEALLVFDLTSAEAYPLGGKPSAPIFPEDWREQFGIPDQEHRKSLEIHTFGGYTIYAVEKDQPAGEDIHD